MAIVIDQYDEGWLFQPKGHRRTSAHIRPGKRFLEGAQPNRCVPVYDKDLRDPAGLIAGRAEFSDPTPGVWQRRVRAHRQTRVKSM